VQPASKVFLIACLALLLSVVFAFADDKLASGAAPAWDVKTNTFVQPKTFAELPALPPDQLEKVDVARIDLLCAEALPGAADKHFA